MPAPPLTSTDIANQALQLIGDNETSVTGLYPNFNSSSKFAAGIALNLLYGTAVQAVLRQHSWDFARAEAPLVLSGNTAPSEWLYEYLYPNNAVQVWQLKPTTLIDPNNPIPIRWVRANTVVSGNQVSVIWTNLTNAIAIFNDNPLESTWPADFQQAVIRLLASELATALAGRPDTAQMMMESGASFESLAEARDS
jgi:hypothetical protein